jgi:spermidine synthase
MELWLYERPIFSEEQGWSYRIKIKRTIENYRTQYQDLAVYESVEFGKVLTLDGVVQLTEHDEPHYHEMLTHVPMLSHPNPEKILIIGGGDGGIVREVLKHPSVKEVHFCELDEEVVKACVRNFPQISCKLSDPRVKHIYSDGCAYTKQFKDYFDIVIVDSTDPVGPAEVLFSEHFFADIKTAMKDKGIFVNQAENFAYKAHFESVSKLFNFLPNLFPHRGYYYTVVPTYPAGIIGFTFLSKATNPYDFSIDPKRIPEGLRYYTEELHNASFAIPKFARDAWHTTNPKR